MAKFLKFIVNTIMILAIVVAASLLIPPFAGVTTVIVDDIEMETNLEIGSVTYAWGVDAGELKVGDKVLLQDDGDMLYTISSVAGSDFVLEDKLSTDGAMITQNLQGSVDKVVLTVPVLGYVSMALRTVEGLIIVGLSVIFVIILFVLAEIWRREEEEDWDEDDEDEESEESDKKETQQSSELTQENARAEADAETTVETKGVDVVEGVSEEVSEEISEETENKEEEIVVVDDAGQIERDLFEETRNVLVADIAGMMETKEEHTQDSQTNECKVTDNEVQGKQEKVLAIPLYTKEELMKRAKAAGDDPELVMDEVSGVTFLDYSDVL